MLAYHFPPMGGAGVQRTSKFVKYLPAAGWTPTVLSAYDASQVQDETLLKDIPANVRVERVEVRKRKRQKLYDFLFSVHLGRLVTWSRYAFELPDRFNRWDADATARLERLIREERPALLFSSSAPFSSHLIAGRAALRHKIPWVADFRDPWSENTDLLENVPQWVRRRHQAMERWVALHASHLTFAHPLIAESFRSRYKLGADKVSTITNGFDPADFIGWNVSLGAQNELRSELAIIHTGSFYRSYNEHAFLSALRFVAKTRPEILKDVTFHFVGGVTEELTNLAPTTVKVYGRLDHRQSLEWLTKADGLLLVIPQSMGAHHVPGKLFEYLAARKPVFAICPPGTTASLLCQSGCGVAYTGTSDLEAGLAFVKYLESLRIGRPGWFTPRIEFIAQFARDNLSSQLARVFDTTAQITDTGDDL